MHYECRQIVGSSDRRVSGPLANTQRGTVLNPPQDLGRLGLAGERVFFDMTFYRTDDRIRMRQVFLLRMPVLMKQRGSLTGRFLMVPTSTSLVGGTSIPTRRANVNIEYSFSGTYSNSREGSFTTQEPPMPFAGMVKPPLVSLTAENLSCTPASEKRSAVSCGSFSGALTSASAPDGQASPSGGSIVTAPGSSGDCNKRGPGAKRRRLISREPISGVTTRLGMPAGYRFSASASAALLKLPLVLGIDTERIKPGDPEQNGHHTAEFPINATTE